MSVAEKLTTIAENQEKVFDAGKKSQYDEFWDTLQENGNRTIYQYAFTRSWKNNILKPKYDIKPTNADYMFRDSWFKGDLAEHLESLGVVLDVSNCTTAIQPFRGMRQVTRLPVINFSKLTNGLGYCFAECTVLKTIDKIILPTVANTSLSNIFYNTTEIEEVRFEGSIYVSLNLNNCSNFSAESALSAINALKNYLGTTSEMSYTITLPINVWNRLAEYGSPPSGNSWKDYVMNVKGWNAA